jgi:deazaflavin-dependent oxidoreductase (nitroreductase family)
MAEEVRRRRPMTRLEKLGERFAQSKPGGWFYVNVANRLDRVVLPLTRGRFSVTGPTSIAPVGLLEHTGAKSGERRRTPLTYLADGDNVVLTASKAGSPRHPAWYHNLKANPEATFFNRRGKLDYVAREADGAERDRLWAEVNDLYAGYETYQGRTAGRRIPVIVLEPKSS